jgi:hypothetical protein
MQILNLFKSAILKSYMVRDSNVSTKHQIIDDDINFKEDEKHRKIVFFTLAIFAKNKQNLVRL